MTIDPEKFEISLDGITYQVIRSSTDKNIYRLNTASGSYLIARDFYGIWIELTSTSNSIDIPLTQIGRLIEDCCSVSSF